MEDAYRKLGTASVGKQHLDQQCNKLSAGYAQVAKENKALAKAHRDMAKQGTRPGGGYEISLRPTSSLVGDLLESRRAVLL
jgi:hypothetical protein